MLSHYQNVLIDALPDEGAPYYLAEGKKVLYPAEAVHECALLPLQGKEPSTNKRAILLHGAPGSGKSYSGMKRLEELLQTEPDRARTTAIISYDEFGAIYDIQEYVAGLMRIEAGLHGQHAKSTHGTLEARRQHWLDFQPLSQFIRSKTLKCALAGEHDLYIDITSSGPGTIALIQLLEALDYQDIEMWSYAAPYRISAERIQQRPRPTSHEELLTKRVGAYDMLPKFLHYVHRLRVFMNESDNIEPQEIAHFKMGHVHRCNPHYTDSLMSMLANDAEDFFNATGGLPLSINSTDLIDRYARAMRDFETMMKPVTESLQPRPDMRFI